MKSFHNENEIVPQREWNRCADLYQLILKELQDEARDEQNECHAK